MIQINLPEATRTIDPVYSFVCLGKELNKFNSKKEFSAFGNGFIFEFFEKVNRTLFLSMLDGIIAHNFIDTKKLTKFLIDLINCLMVS